MVGLLAIMALTGELLVSVVGAGLTSATVNFCVMRRLVFGSSAPVGRAAARYATLAISLAAANYVLVLTLTTGGLGLVTAQLVTEATLYVTSYAVQNRLVFRRGADASGEERANERLYVALTSSK